MGEVITTIDVALLLLAAGVYAYLGHIVAKRRVGGDAQSAIDGFAVWWYGLAILTGLSGIARVLAIVGASSVALHVALTYLILLAVCIAIAGLLYYLVYLYTGSRAWLWPIVAAYTVYLVAIVSWIVWQQPVGLDVTPTAVTIEYARSSPPWVLGALTLALLVPTMLGAIAYARLYFRVRDPTPRYRIGLVSTSIIVWFGVSLVGWAAGVNDGAYWPLVTRVVGLLASLTILAAFRPPAFVQRRWGIHPVDDATGVDQGE